MRKERGFENIKIRSAQISLDYENEQDGYLRICQSVGSLSNYLLDSCYINVKSIHVMFIQRWFWNSHMIWHKELVISFWENSFPILFLARLLFLWHWASFCLYLSHICVAFRCMCVAFVLYFIVFVSYLCCICVVFVLLLCCVCVVFVLCFIIFVWDLCCM